MSQMVGEQHSTKVGLYLMAIAIVETRAGKRDFNVNHICGAHQLDINYAKVSCSVVESNHYVSAKLALANLLFWKEGRTWDKALKMYNVGYTNHPHGKEYLRRIKLTIRILEKHYE